MKNTLVGIVLGVSMVSVVACGGGGDDDETRPPASSGLEAKLVKDLTPDQAKTECGVLVKKTTMSKEDHCELEGVFGSALGQSCDAIKQQCMNAPEDPAQNDGCTLEDKTKTAGCMATVAEIESCTDAMVAEIKALTCQSKPTDLANMPSQCEVVQSKCPEFFKSSAQPSASPSGTP